MWIDKSYIFLFIDLVYSKNQALSLANLTLILRFRLIT